LQGDKQGFVAAILQHPFNPVDLISLAGMIAMGFVLLTLGPLP